MSPPVNKGGIGPSLGLVNMERQIEQMITCFFDETSKKQVCVSD